MNSSSQHLSKLSQEKTRSQRPNLTKLNCIFFFLGSVFFFFSFKVDVFNFQSFRKARQQLPSFVFLQNKTQFRTETVWESGPLKVCINYIIFSLILKHTPLVIRCIKIQCLQKQWHEFQMTIIPGNLDYMELVVFRCIVQLHFFIPRFHIRSSTSEDESEPS